MINRLSTPTRVSPSLQNKIIGIPSVENIFSLNSDVPILIYLVI